MQKGLKSLRIWELRADILNSSELVKEHFLRFIPLKRDQDVNVSCIKDQE